jgi:hypothetical protein
MQENCCSLANKLPDALNHSVLRDMPFDIVNAVICFALAFFICWLLHTA